MKKQPISPKGLLLGILLFALALFSTVFVFSLQNNKPAASADSPITVP